MASTLNPNQKVDSLVSLSNESTTYSSLVQPTMDLLEQIAAPSSVDLLSLSLDTDSVSNNDFGDFMSAGPLPYMPSQLLLNDLVDLRIDAPDACLQSDSKLTKGADDARKPKNSIMELFNRGGAIRKVTTTQSINNDGENTKGKKAKKAPNGKANWMDLFAELDPLANPDLMEKKLTGEHSNSQAA